MKMRVCPFRNIRICCFEWRISPRLKPNWNDKATSLREIARKLSLGLDSFVFLDDNALEREWVRSQLPEVAVVELRHSVFDYVADLDRGKHFEALTLSAEDRARADQYRSEAARKHLQATSQSLDEFLAQLQLRASHAPVNGKNLARVAQLTNKTNQFNLTTRRYTEAQVQKLAEDPGVGRVRSICPIEWAITVLSVSSSAVPRNRIAGKSIAG